MRAAFSRVVPLVLYRFPNDLNLSRHIVALADHCHVVSKSFLERLVLDISLPIRSRALDHKVHTTQDAHGVAHSIFPLFVQSLII